MPNNKPKQMETLTERDIQFLIEDLLLYSGNIREVDGLHGPHAHNAQQVGGVIHTWMDSFHFFTNPLFCDEYSWTIFIPNPFESLRQGHRITERFAFPKIHLDTTLKARYKTANILYNIYNGYTGITEKDRRGDLEDALGYEKLKSIHHVKQAIIRDFRSYKIQLPSGANDLFMKN